MALVAKMIAAEVKHRGGGHWEACEEEDEGAIDVAECPAVQNLYPDPPQWLLMTGWVRFIKGTSSEEIELNAVGPAAGTDPDKGNSQWAMASPAGKLTMTIHNPGAWDYVQPGFEYRITIEKIRGPRDS